MGVVLAQDRSTLEKERMRVIEQIEFTDELISDQTKKARQELQILSALKAQIQQRNTLVENIKSSILTSEVEIEKNQVLLDSLEAELRDLSMLHQQTLRSKYIRKLKSGQWISILSAKSINDAFLKWNYYRQFDQYHAATKATLKSLRDQIKSKTKEMKDYALENSQLIRQQEIQNSMLQQRIDEKNAFLRDLEKDKSILTSQLEAQQTQREALNQAIENRIFNRESKNAPSYTKEQKTSLASLKGSLPLPATHGFIIDVAHEASLNLRVADNAKIIAIADGKVIDTKSVSGFGKMIIIQHGEYYSIYGNMSTIVVSAGQEVVAHQILGTPSKSNPTLHFELWKGKSKLQARDWIVE